jgi:hypothetical protein
VFALRRRIRVLVSAWSDRLLIVKRDDLIKVKLFMELALVFREVVVCEALRDDIIYSCRDLLLGHSGCGTT